MNSADGRGAFIKGDDLGAVDIDYGKVPGKSVLESPGKLGIRKDKDVVGPSMTEKHFPVLFQLAWGANDKDAFAGVLGRVADVTAEALLPELLVLLKDSDGLDSRSVIFLNEDEVLGVVNAGRAVNVFCR